VASVQPLLEAKDMEGLLCHLKRHYSPDQITGLLSCRDCDARKVAALSLALVGGRCCIDPLAERLRDPDSMTNQMAEHALWSIWFRCGTQAANAELARGTQCLSDRKFDCAFKHFERALELDPNFAEAYNQRAIAYYLLEDYENSKTDCQYAIDRMPSHFGAWAGKGHCHAHLAERRDAIKCYEKALSINPHLECLQQAIGELRKQLMGE
jgi:tetratricopeptide (TPR) repeat protein